MSRRAEDRRQRQVCIRDRIIDEREQKLVGSIESTMDAAVKRMKEAMKRTTNPGGLPLYIQMVQAVQQIMIIC